jgi:hypothetical protein
LLITGRVNKNAYMSEVPMVRHRLSIASTNRNHARVTASKSSIAWCVELDPRAQTANAVGGQSAFLTLVSR